MACDIQTLMTSARCFATVPVRGLLPMQTALLCDIGGGILPAGAWTNPDDSNNPWTNPDDPGPWTNPDA